MTRPPQSAIEMLTYAAAWFDDLDDLTAKFAEVTGQPFEVQRDIQADLMALGRWFAEHSDAADEAFAYVQRNGAGRDLAAARACWCAHCEGVVLAADHPDDPIAQLGGRRFITCNRCGDKRCPRAAHHSHPCEHRP